MTDDEYNKQCREFVEAIRREFDFGFGEGHQTTDMLRVIKAQHDVFEKLTAAEVYELQQRPHRAPIQIIRRIREGVDK